MQAIPVADAILAQLQKSQFPYFYDGDPVEHVWEYGKSCFLPQRLLHLLTQDYITHHAASEISLQDLIPSTLSVFQNVSLTTPSNIPEVDKR